MFKTAQKLARLVSPLLSLNCIAYYYTGKISMHNKQHPQKNSKWSPASSKFFSTRLSDFLS